MRRRPHLFAVAKEVGQGLLSVAYFLLTNLVLAHAGITGAGSVSEFCPLADTVPYGAAANTVLSLG